MIVTVEPATVHLPLAENDTGSAEVELACTWNGASPNVCAGNRVERDGLVGREADGRRRRRASPWP